MRELFGNVSGNHLVEIQIVSKIDSGQVGIGSELVRCVSSYQLTHKYTGHAHISAFTNSWWMLEKILDNIIIISSK